MQQRRTYKNPPIEEALVELRFLERTAWPEDTSDQLQRVPSIAKRYSDPTREQNLVHVPGPNGLQVLLPHLKRTQLVEPNGGLVSVGARILSATSLRPYEGWPHLRARVQEIVSALREINPALEFDSISRIGVRYVNMIAVKGLNLNLGELFNISPMVPEGIPLSVNGFFSRVETTLEGEEGIRFVLGFGSLPPMPDGTSSFVLDLDLFSEFPSGLGVRDIWELVDRLHAAEGDAFERCITDNLRSLLDA